MKHFTLAIFAFLFLLSVSIADRARSAPATGPKKIFQTPSAVASYGPDSTFRATYTPTPTPAPAATIPLPAPAAPTAPAPKYTSNSGVYQDATPGPQIYTGSPESNGTVAAPQTPGDPILDPATIPREITIDPKDTPSPN